MAGKLKKVYSSKVESYFNDNTADEISKKEFLQHVTLKQMTKSVQDGFNDLYKMKLMPKIQVDITPSHIVQFYVNKEDFDFFQDGATWNDEISGQLTDGVGENGFKVGNFMFFVS
uniref:Uncharacterized protein n=1 Tax=viral metagenome TaxID=1070528 RepID=A0A6C0JUG9_9ZZZZ